MSENKHTPGPWEVGDPKREDEFYGLTDIIKRNHPDAKRIRVLATTNWNFTAEARANARLIAAAPDLLSALIGVLRVADRKTDEFDAARAAIAKAVQS